MSTNCSLSLFNSLSKLTNFSGWSRAKMWEEVKLFLRSYTAMRKRWFWLTKGLRWKQMCRENGLILTQSILLGEPRYKFAKMAKVFSAHCVKLRFVESNLVLALKDTKTCFVFPIGNNLKSTKLLGTSKKKNAKLIISCKFMRMHKSCPKKSKSVPGHFFQKNKLRFKLQNLSWVPIHGLAMTNGSFNLQGS